MGARIWLQVARATYIASIPFKTLDILFIANCMAQIEAT